MLFFTDLGSLAENALDARNFCICYITYTYKMPHFTVAK
jgi:hypothetical protein